MELDELLNKVKAALSPDDFAILAQKALNVTAPLPWVPNPGPQTEAYYCPADEIFFGGEAGGAKTDLELGLALTAHQQSLILRRTNKEAVGLVERLEQIQGSRDGWNSQDDIWRLQDGRTIEIGGCEREVDKQKYKGRPHDLIAFDEVTDFLQSQVEFIIGWNRSADPNQRCRVVLAGNPPTRIEGLWIIRRYAAWLDPHHPKPAKPGELRWYTSNDQGEEIEVDGPGPHQIGKSKVIALSRTFIRSRLANNPDYARTNYQAKLDAMPGHLRAAYRDGRFDAMLEDSDRQVIPTSWVMAAEERWRKDGARDQLMTAMALDPAGGGKDAAALSRRYGPWFDEVLTEQGAQTADGSLMAAWVVRYRRHNAGVVIDTGGGYGGAPMLRLKDNDIQAQGFDGAAKSPAMSRDGTLRFANKRAEAYWKFMEELDPDVPGGSVIALPPDPELRADLCAPTWEITRNGILLESKDSIKERLGRSPNKGDAVVMCWTEGERAAVRAVNRARFGTRDGRPKVVMGHDQQRGRRR